MADRFPLIANTSANQIQELSASDNLDLTGNSIVGLSTIAVGSGVTITDGNGFFTGVITSTSFNGDGSGLTGVASTDNIRTNTNATFLQNVSVVGTSTVTGNIIPSSDSATDIGTSSVRFANIYGDTLYGDGSNLTNVGGGSLEFSSKTTISVSSSTTQINFFGLAYNSMYKVIVKLARMSGSGEPFIYLYRDGSINTLSNIDYVSHDPGSNQRYSSNQSYIKVYTYGYEDKNWEYEMTFSTGYHGWFRGTGHPNGNNYAAGWTNWWGHFNSSYYSTSRISGISLRHGNSRTFDTPSEVILYRIKES